MEIVTPENGVVRILADEIHEICSYAAAAQAEEETVRHAKKVMQAARLTWFNRQLAGGKCRICGAKWSEPVGHEVSNHEAWCGYRILREALGDQAHLSQEEILEKMGRAW